MTQLPPDRTRSTPAPASPRRSLALLAGSLLVLVLVLCAPAAAFNYVADANGTHWGIQDVAPPGVDTGSIRATQIGPGQAPAYSTTLNGFGGIRVLVPTGNLGAVNPPSA